MGKKRRLILVGLPLFAKRLHAALENKLIDWEVIHLDTYTSRFDKIRAVFLLPNADIVYSINGTITGSKVFDIALRNRVKCIMHWVGTDVLNAIQAHKSGDFRLDFIEKVHHLCEVDWIQDELKPIGIHAKILNFASFNHSFEIQVPKGKKLRLLTYMSDARAEFYGLPKVIELAKVFPEVSFTIVGAKASDFHPLPKNVEALGWVENIDFHFDNSHATIRIPKHDGLSNFVLESLARGKHVLYNHPYSHCNFCPTHENLEQAIRQLKQTVEQDTFKPNLAGKQFVEREFNSNYVFSQLIREFETVVG